jgi:tRNA(fMet)-specific endonuclease VapC
VNERFLLDTNALSEPIQRSPNAAFLTHFHANTGQMATAVPTFHEMLFGCRRLPPSRRRNDIEAFIQTVVIGTMLILPYDQDAAEWHAAERVRLAAIGRTPPFVDRQIAAVAATRGLILVTANLADFQHFAGLTLVDWRI